MKRVIPLSLMGGILVALLLWSTRHQADKPSQSDRPTTPSKDPASTNHPRPTPPLVAHRTGETPWASIESGNSARFIANLRAIGCPEQTIQDLVTFRVCRAYQNRLIEDKMRLLTPLGYTKGYNAASLNEFRLHQRELRAAAENDLEALLGVSATKLRAGVLGQPGSAGSFLPLEKRGQAREVTERYERLIAEAKQELGGLYGFYGNPKIDAKVEELNQRKQAELAQLLTPYEQQESLMRSSPAAKYVLEHLPEAGSESEFRTMVRVVHDVGIEEPKTGGNRYGLGLNKDDGNKERDIAEKQAELERRLKEVLGEARFAEMQSAEQKRQLEEN